MEHKTKTLRALCAALALAPAARAQHEHSMPGLPPPAAPKEASSTPNTGGGMGHRGRGMSMPGMERGGRMMSSSVDRNDRMNREGSGTSWLPDSTPMYGKMIMRPNGDMLMLHGAVTPRYIKVGSKRGDDKGDAPNWFMGMYGHPLSVGSQLGLRLMMSLDPITEYGSGYPLLFQTGESWRHQPLHDRQHPHDLFSELSVSYSRLLGTHGNSAYLYLGYPGEPALGPPTFMHRLIAFDLPDAPIGHHWQDATHITFGAATAGLNLSGKVKLEGSVFTGREPDENRYDFDRPRFDSQSGRLSFNPNPNNALQVSYGFVKNAEGDGANQHRTTASWIYNKPLGGDANVTTSLVWGQNNLAGEGKTNSYLAEADYQSGANTFFMRVENIQKSGHELVLPEALHERKFGPGAYTAGCVRDLSHGKGIDTGIGAAITLNTKPSSLNAFYGNSNAPISYQVMFRFRPSRMSGEHGHMMGMDRSGIPMPPSGAQGASGLTLTATAAPDPPRVGKNRVTVMVTDAAGQPVRGAQVRASVAMTTMDMGTTRPSFEEKGDGRYVGEVSFSMAGPWRVTLSITPPQGKAPTVKQLDYDVVRP